MLVAVGLNEAQIIGVKPAMPMGKIKAQSLVSVGKNSGKINDPQSLVSVGKN